MSGHTLLEVILVVLLVIAILLLITGRWRLGAALLVVWAIMVVITLAVTSRAGSATHYYTCRSDQQSCHN